MKLNKKLFVYMSAIGLVMLVFISAYLIGLAPGLYLAYQKSKSIDLAINMHKQFLIDRSYKNLNPENQFATASFVLPKQGYDISIASKLISLDTTLTSGEYQKKLDEVREIIEKVKKGDFSSSSNFEMDLDIGQIDGIKINKLEEFGLPSSIREGDWNMKTFGSTKLMYGSISDRGIEYVSIWAFDENSNEYIITLVPLIYSSINDIMPVLLNMLPTILIGLLLILILASKMVSKSVIDPIIMLQRHSARLSSQSPSTWTSLNMQGKDEIAELSQRLDELHAEVRRSYENIQTEKARQELFIRASSHELKTPLASALMLCDSMISKIGKYADHDKYLPELKNILLTMSKMLEELLPLRKSSMNMQDIEMRSLFENIIDGEKYLLEQRNMEYTITGELSIKTWQDIAERIVKAGIGNAISHGKDGDNIKIVLSEDGFSIENSGHIEYELLKHAFEPFVSSDVSKGHGLGLYIARSYSKILGWEIDIKNTKEGVMFICKTKKLSE